MKNSKTNEEPSQKFMFKPEDIDNKNSSQEMTIVKDDMANKQQNDNEFTIEEDSDDESLTITISSKRYDVFRSNKIFSSLYSHTFYSRFKY